MGDFEVPVLAGIESSVKYHPFCFVILILSSESWRKTVLGGQFNWGGCLLKCNGGAQRFPQPGWQSGFECKCTRELDCETDGSSRDESRN